MCMFCFVHDGRVEFISLRVYLFVCFYCEIVDKIDKDLFAPNSIQLIL